MWKRRTLLVASFVVVFTAASFAGNSVSVVCRNERCDFKGNAIFGGTRMTEGMTGYCAECQKFVRIAWTREGKEPKTVIPPSKPLGKLWIPSTGQTVDVYACPHCSKPFIPIKSPNELTHCPKCGEPTLRTRAEGIVD